MKTPAFGYYTPDGPAAFSIELAGALAAEGAKKLEQDRRSASAVVGKKGLVVDLSFLKEIWRSYRSGSFLRNVLPIIGLLVLLISASASAQPLPIVQPTTPPESIAFARYIAWLQARDPFAESGPVALTIVASLP